MKRLTINLRTAKDVEVEPIMTLPDGRIYDPGVIKVGYERVRRLRAGEIFLVTVVCATGKTKLVATAFHNGMGVLRYDGQQLDKFRKTTGGEWEKVPWNNESTLIR